MTSRSRKELKLKNWRRIPEPIKSDMDEIAKFTKRTGREGSITFGIKKHSARLYSCANAKGDANSTTSPSCDTRFGDSLRIGDAHSHPVTSDTIGVLPSPSDISSTVSDSGKEKLAQTSCVTSHETPLIICYQPKTTPSKQKIREYNQARTNYNRTGSERYYANNIEKDFDFALFERDTGTRNRYPPASEVIDASFGAAKQGLRKDVEPLGRDDWCQYTAALTGSGRRRDVIEQCKSELSKRSILGFEF